MLDRRKFLTGAVAAALTPFVPAPAIDLGLLTRYDPGAWPDVCRILVTCLDPEVIRAVFDDAPGA